MTYFKEDFPFDSNQSLCGKENGEDGSGNRASNGESQRATLIKIKCKHFSLLHQKIH